MLTRKLWDYTIETKEGKGVSIIKKRVGKVHEFILKQLKKRYIKPLKLSQMAPVFFIEKKDSEKQMVQDYLLGTNQLLNQLH